MIFRGWAAAVNPGPLWPISGADGEGSNVADMDGHTVVAKLLSPARPRDHRSSATNPSRYQERTEQIIAGDNAPTRIAYMHHETRTQEGALQTSRKPGYHGG
jgi:hypothetical protein